MRKMFILIPAFLSVVALTSCEGRTMKNVEPDGDTVEVEIEARADSMAEGMGI